LIERVILSAGAMLIFSVSFQIDQMPEGKEEGKKKAKQEGRTCQLYRRIAGWLVLEWR